MNQTIDIGVNLMNKAFHADREDVLERAEKAGVWPIVITGTSEESSVQAAKYAQTRPGKLFATAGVHPHAAKNCTDKTIGVLRKLAKEPHVVAIGECGLDHNRDFSPRDVQKKWFEEQIKLAIECNLPLFLHERDAHFEFVKMMKPYAKQVKAVVHCFTGTLPELQAYLHMGFYIGITGWICNESRGKTLKDVVKHIPLNRLMIETDAPYLTPRDLKEKPKNGRNEPVHLPHVAQAIAGAIGKTADEVADATTKTAKEFFGLS